MSLYIFFNSYLYSPVSVSNLFALDTISTSALANINSAYSCKRLLSRYTGPTMSLRGNSDALQTNLTDFYADGYGNLGTSLNATGNSLSVWMNTYGYSNVFVQTLYDQSGNGRNAVQTSNTLQPRFMIENKLLDMTSNSYFTLPVKSFPPNNVPSTASSKVGNLVTLGTGNLENGILSSGTTGTVGNAYQLTFYNYSNYFFAIWGSSIGTPSGTFSNINSVVTMKMSNTGTIQTTYPYARGTTYPLGSLTGCNGYGSYDTTTENPPQAMTSNTSTINGKTYIASASETYLGAPFYVFDKNTTSELWWHSQIARYNTTTGVYTGPYTVNGISGEWIDIKLPDAITLASYSITNRNYSAPVTDSIVQAPWQFTLMGTNNGSTWTNIDLNRTQTWSGAGQTYTYSVSTTSSFNQYRLVVQKSGATYSPGYATADRIIILEIKLFGSGIDVIGSSINTTGGTITDRCLRGYMNYLTVFNTALTDSDRVTMETQDLFATPDPYYEYVKLLLHGDGFNGGNVFVDNSIFNSTIRLTAGTPTTSNTQLKFGQTSMYFPNAAYITAPSSINFNFSTTNFTIEFWFYALNATVQQRFIGNQSGASFPSGSWAIGLSNPQPSGKIWLITNDNGTNRYVGPSTQTISNNTWYHYAVVRNGSSFTQYINGVADGTLTFSGNLDVPGTSYPINVGGSGFNTSTNETYTGYIDDLRITTGVARYTSNFSVPTAPYPPYEYPPTALTNDTTTLSSQLYGNGTYITNASSTSNTSSNAWYSFDKSNVSAAWSSGSYYNSGSTGDYISTRKTNTIVSGTTYLGEWLEITLPHQIVLEGYTLTSRNDTSWTQAPANFVVAGTNSYSNVVTPTWTLIDSQTSAPWTRQNQTLSFSTVRNSTGYIRYRLIVTKLFNGTNGTAATPIEWRLFGYPYSQTSPLDGLSTTAKSYLRGAYAFEPLFSQASFRPVINLTCGSSTQDFYGDTSGTNLTTLPFGKGQSFVDWKTANGGGTVYINTWYDQSYYVNGSSIQYNATASGSQRPFVETTTTPWSANCVTPNTFLNLPTGTVPLNSSYSFISKNGAPITNTAGGILGSSSSNNYVSFNGNNGYINMWSSNSYQFSLQSTFDSYYSNVTLLLHGDGPNGAANAFIDSSFFDNSLTAIGAPITSSIQKVFGYASINTGTGSFVDTPTNSTFIFGTNNFTIEFWFYGSAINTTQRILGNCPNAWQPGCFVIGTYATSKLGFETNNRGSVTSTNTYNNNTWYHYAAVRQGRTITQYINGIADGSFTLSASDLDTQLGATARLRIGGSGNGTTAGESFVGYLDDVRITNGIARYTSNFTVPVLPFTPVEYPPSALSGTASNVVTTTLSSQLYGNGVYVASCGPNRWSTFGAGMGFDKAQALNNNMWATNSSTYNSSTGLYDTSLAAGVTGGVQTTAGVNGEWLQIQLPIPIVLTKYTLTGRDTNAYIQNPRNWTVFASNDGSSWTVIDTRSNVTAWASVAYGIVNYTITNSNPYLYYRIVVTAVQVGSGGAAIEEWKLFTNTTEFGSIGGPNVLSLVNYATQDPPTNTTGKYASSSNSWTTYGLVNGVAPLNTPITTRVGWQGGVSGTYDYLCTSGASGPSMNSYMYWSVLSSQALSDTDRKIIETLDGPIRGPGINNTSFELPTTDDFTRSATYWNVSSGAGVARDSGSTFLISNSNVVQGSQCLFLQSTTANGYAYSNTVVSNLYQGVPYTLSFSACYRSQTGLLPTDFYVNVNGSNLLFINAYTLSNTWYQYTTPAFSNVSSNALVQFTANAATDSTIYIDAVSMTSLDTPKTFALDGLSTNSLSSMNGAYSFSRLLTRYTGPTVRIRRSSDNTTLNFYADQNGVLGTGLNGTGTSLSSWLGSSNAFVNTWYDQSGKENHAVQSTALNQPLYSNLAILFSSNTYLQMPDNTIPGGNSSYTMVVKHGSISNYVSGYSGFLSANTTILTQSSSYSNGTIQTLQVSNGNYADTWYGSNVVAGTVTGATTKISTVYNNTSGRTLYVNGTVVGSDSSITRGVLSSNNVIGVQNGYFLTGNVFYISIFNTALSSTDRVISETV